MDIEQDIDTQDIDASADTQEPTNRRRKNPLGVLKDRLKAIDKLINDPKNKSGKQSDLCIQASEIERLLWQADRDDKANENLAKLATLTAQHEQDTQEIARLTQENAELKARTQVNASKPPERIPDSLQQEVQTLEELLKSVATLARAADIEERTRVACRLILNYGKRAHGAVTDLGVDYASVFQTLQVGQVELLSRLERAQQEGSGTVLARAVLFVRDSITACGIGKRQYPDQFSESSLYADTL